MSFLNSSNVKVFPFAGSRINSDISGKVLNEQNITNVIKSLTEKETYVIDAEKNSEDLYSFRFVLDGYIFDVKDVSRTPDSPLYACIKKSNDDYSFLEGEDTITVYQKEDSKFVYKFNVDGSVTLKTNSGINVLVNVRVDEGENLTISLSENGTVYDSVDRTAFQTSNYMLLSGKGSVTITSEGEISMFTGLELSTSEPSEENGVNKLFIHLLDEYGKVPVTSIQKHSPQTCGLYWKKV